MMSRGQYKARQTGLHGSLWDMFGLPSWDSLANSARPEQGLKLTQAIRPPAGVMRVRTSEKLSGWILAMLAVAGAVLDPPAADGQTYRQRVAQAGSERIDGLPDQLATRPVPPAAVDPLDASSGQELVAAAARQAFALPSLQAKVRMKLASQGRQIVASGDYLQVGSGAEKLLKLNLKVPIGNKFGSLQQIRGQHYLWMIRDLPPDDPKLERVTLRNARIAIARREAAGTSPPGEDWMLLGGLSRLLVSLDSNFDFGTPRPAMLGEVPVLLVRGTWKAESLAHLMGRKPPADLPPQLPQEVELTLGAPDQAYPLFPYRIEYVRRDAAAEQGRGGTRAALTLIEFFEVRQASDVDRGQFEFNSEERDFDDVTMAYLRKLGIGPPK
jgi:hypothetical protein